MHLFIIFHMFRCISSLFSTCFDASLHYFPHVSMHLFIIFHIFPCISSLFFTSFDASQTNFPSTALPLTPIQKFPEHIFNTTQYLHQTAYLSVKFLVDVILHEWRVVTPVIGAVAVGVAGVAVGGVTVAGVAAGATAVATQTGVTFQQTCKNVTNAHFFYRANKILL